MGTFIVDLFPAFIFSVVAVSTWMSDYGGESLVVAVLRISFLAVESNPLRDPPFLCCIALLFFYVNDVVGFWIHKRPNG
jgi:hypothetical protein